jgi:hypothetical protein
LHGGRSFAVAGGTRVSWGVGQETKRSGHKSRDVVVLKVQRGTKTREEMTKEGIVRRQKSIAVGDSEAVRHKHRGCPNWS